MKDYKNYKPGRISKKRSKKKLMPGLFKAVLAIAVIVASLFAARYSYRKLLKTRYFALKEIVVAGEKRVKRDEIIALSGVKIGKNILAMDIKGMAGRIESQPWIETATVRRVLPRGLSIEVKEREPVAILKAESLYYLDREGTPFKELDKKDATNYPVITGISRKEFEGDEPAREALMKTVDFIDVAAEWPEELAVSEIRVNKNQGISVFSDGIEVRVGFGDYALKVQRLKRVLDDLQARGKTAGYIDLTYTGQAVVR